MLGEYRIASSLSFCFQNSDRMASSLTKLGKRSSGAPCRERLSNLFGLAKFIRTKQWTEFY